MDKIKDVVLADCNCVVCLNLREENNAYDQGYSEGLEEGRDVGWEQGFQDGYKAAQEDNAQ